MSIWFNDKDHPENRNKRRFLKEIFKVAETEERFKAGEIGMSSTSTGWTKSRLLID
ncbi:hypothetical protein BGZ60DRAFT_379577 [Tricladium varicosporioides]|nr:hypothetical protein BGZ60DRAFT_379577 [Hymenoscyphus varicosporioides]